MINKVKDLRKLFPIPMSEALLLLTENNGDIQLCAEKFKTNAIAKICAITGGDINLVCKYYEEEKYDFNRTISSVNNYIFDLNYKPIEGLTAESIRQVIQWINFGEDKDFATSLDYKYLETILQTLSLIPKLVEYGKITEKAKIIYDSLFDGYSDEMPMEEFVRRHKRLDDNLDFQEANTMFLLSKVVFKDELRRHLRNNEAELLQ